MQALLRNVSQSSSEKSSEGGSRRCFRPGDGNWVRQWGLCPQSFPQTQKQLAALWPSQHSNSKKVKMPFPGPPGEFLFQAWKSDPQLLSLGSQPSQLAPGMTGSGRQQKNKKHWREAPIWASARTICKFHGLRDRSSPLNLKIRDVKRWSLDLTGPRT
jgi:hypothetical protein